MNVIESMTRTPNVIGREVEQILQLLRTGLAAYMERSFPEQKFSQDSALPWIHVHHPEILSSIRTRLGDATTALGNEAAEMFREYSRLEGELLHYTQLARDQEITHAFVAEQGSRLGCTEINEYRRIFQAKVLAIASHSATIMMAMQEVFASYSVIHVCPPDRCELPGLTGFPWAAGGSSRERVDVLRTHNTATSGEMSSGLREEYEQKYAAIAQTIENLETERRQAADRLLDCENRMRELEVKLQYAGPPDEPEMGVPTEGAERPQSRRGRRGARG